MIYSPTHKCGICGQEHCVEHDHQWDESSDDYFLPYREVGFYSEEEIKAGKEDVPHLFFQPRRRFTHVCPSCKLAIANTIAQRRFVSKPEEVGEE